MKTFFFFDNASDLITYVLTENTSMLSTFIRLSNSYCSAKYRLFVLCSLLSINIFHSLIFWTELIGKIPICYMRFFHFKIPVDFFVIQKTTTLPKLNISANDVVK